MAMISYAQNGEDVVIARAFGPEHNGFYIDVGASDPVVDSVTKHFSDHGWSGINVEPAAPAVAMLREQRPRDTNLELGIGTAPGQLTFYELPSEMIGCSTFSRELADEYASSGWEIEIRTVEVATLAAVCEEHVGERTIDFMKIDVEGDEKAVLEGADFERFRPRVLVVEATRPGTTVQSHELWEGDVLAAGYRFTLFDGINRFYVRDEDRDLIPVLSAPANVLDDFLPYQTVVWREQAEQSAAALALKEAELALQKDVEQALELTRGELARSQAALRDARAELKAVRGALVQRLRAPAAPDARRSSP
jgi:FkbM family methyltransferase